MSMIEWRDFIVRYTCFNDDGSIASFFAARFAKKWKAKWFIWKKNRKKSKNEYYTLVGEKEDIELYGKYGKTNNNKRRRI